MDLSQLYYIDEKSASPTSYFLKLFTDTNVIEIDHTDIHKSFYSLHLSWMMAQIYSQIPI